MRLVFPQAVKLLPFLFIRKPNLNVALGMTPVTEDA
jgi:hypothetical protein